MQKFVVHRLILSWYPVARSELPKLPSAVIVARGTYAAPPASVPASLPDDVVSHAAQWMSRILDASPVELHPGKLWDFLTADDAAQFGGLPSGVAREDRGALLLMQLVCESRVVLCGPYAQHNAPQNNAPHRGVAATPAGTNARDPQEAKPTGRRDAHAADAGGAGAAAGAENGDAAMASADETGDEGGAAAGAILSCDKRPPAAPSPHKSPAVKRRRRGGAERRAAVAAAPQKPGELFDGAEEAGAAGGGVSDKDAAAAGAVSAAAAEPPAAGAAGTPGAAEQRTAAMLQRMLELRKSLSRTKRDPKSKDPAAGDPGLASVRDVLRRLAPSTGI